MLAPFLHSFFNPTLLSRLRTAKNNSHALGVAIGFYWQALSLLNHLGKIEILPGMDVSLLIKFGQSSQTLKKAKPLIRLKKLKKMGLVYFHFLLEKLPKTNSPF
jgi:hypothetical protein